MLALQLQLTSVIVASCILSLSTVSARIPSPPFQLDLNDITEPARVKQALMNIKRSRILPLGKCYLYAELEAILTRWGSLRSRMESSDVAEAVLIEAQTFIHEYLDGFECLETNTFCSTVTKTCTCWSLKFDSKNELTTPNADGSACVIPLDSPCDYQYRYDFYCQPGQNCYIEADDVLCTENNYNHRDKTCQGVTMPNDVKCRCMNNVSKVTFQKYDETKPPRIPNCEGYKSFDISEGSRTSGIPYNILLHVIWTFNLSLCLQF